jgi:iron complex outermembrane receptor protein
MKIRLAILLASASIGATASAARAQSAPGAAPAESATLGEIVVTARVKSESLQEVPQVVNAVTADALQKLNIIQFQDVQNVVPGLSLATNNAGYGSSASLRGVSYDVLIANPEPTVALYLNDAPVQTNFLFQSLFDVGQVEVLRGPQGATRGVSAPSGAITVTTRKPDLSTFGGYFSGQLTDQAGRNVQGALNIPIIKDVLAIRVSALIDETRANGVRSIHSSIPPKNKSSAERVAVSFEPSDAFNANIVYQHLDTSLTQFQQESGPGPAAAPGLYLVNSLINPQISARDRAAVDDSPVFNHTHYDEVTAQAESRFFGQHLRYVGSYTHQAGRTSEPQDYGNVLPGYAAAQDVHIALEQTTQELRLSNDTAPGRMVDYSVGAFYSWQFAPSTISTPVFFFPGAFGQPPGYDPSAFSRRYTLYSNFAISTVLQETSVFGALTLHLGANTELSGGMRHIWTQYTGAPTDALSAAFAAVPAGLFGGACIPGLAGASPTYPGFCDFPIPSPPQSFPPFRSSQTPNIYTVSLSHHVIRDLLIYANTGTAFRTAFSTLGLQGAINTDPATANLVNHPPETSVAYEVGVKSTWFDGRARLNAAIFRQRFHNLPVAYLGTVYKNTLSGTPAVSNSIGASVDALVQGFDIDSALQITRAWNVSLQASYADAKVQGSMVPCNITGPGGAPVFNTGGIISFCPGGAASHLPLWNASLQSEYVHPLAGDSDGFLRGLLTYYPENTRAEPGLTVGNYSLVNLYAGVRNHDGAWEVALFARNAFNTKQLLDRYDAQESGYFSAVGYALAPNSGYFRTTFTPPREVGVSARYAWGSR